jgi:hypothetical protein
MPWFCLDLDLAFVVLRLRAHEAAGQRDLERARARVEHLVGGVLEGQELEDLQRVLAHLDDDPAARADGDRRRIRGARQRADLGARAAALGHPERHRVEAEALPVDDHRVAGLAPDGQAR